MPNNLIEFSKIDKINLFGVEQFDSEKVTEIIEDNTIVIITNSDGIITHINKNYCSLSQFTADELKGKTFRIMNSGYHEKAFFKNLWDTILSGNIWKGEIKDKAKDGSFFWVDTKITPVLNEAGLPKEFVVLRTNITAQKNLEIKLNKSLHLLDAIMNTSQDAQIVFEQCSGKISYFNNLAKDFMLKYYDKSINIGDVFINIVPADKKPEFELLIEQCIDSNLLHYELNFFKGESQEIWFAIKMAVIKNETNQNFVSISFLDTTMAKKAELQLKKHNQILEEAVLLRTNQLLEAFTELQQKNKEVNDSLQYASKIQRAMFPSDKSVLGSFSESMLLYKPKDVVSGDFYYYDNVNDGYCFIAGDCTGHGVPGALLSMFAVKTLKEIIQNNYDLNPAQVLNMMAAEVLLYLQEKVSDGMDLTIAFINKEKTNLVFASANQKICRVRHGALRVYTGNKMGLHSHMSTDYFFSNHIIDLQPGDKIYMFSDGYADQFGYKNSDSNKPSKRLMTKNFFNLIQNSNNLSMKEQKQFLLDYHNSWRNNTEEQTDDILVFGLKI